MRDRFGVAVGKGMGILLVGSLGIVSCGGAEPEIVTRQTDEGTVVTNLRAADAVPGGSLRLLWRHASDEWMDPTDVVMEDTGLVVVADPPAGRVHAIGAEGERVTSWGRLGEGPGEWRGVAGLVLHGREVLVRPSSAPYLERFDENGEPMGRLEIGEPFSLVAALDSVLIGAASWDPGRLVLIDPWEGTVLNDLQTGPTQRYPVEQYGSCWRLAAARDRIHRLTCSAGRVEVLDLSGRRTALFELADEPRRSTEDELDSYIERLWASQSGGRPLSPLVQRQLEGLREAAVVFPRYAALRVDPGSGRLILVEQPFGDHGSDEATLHIVSEDGQHTNRIETGVRIRDLAVVGDTLAMLVRDPATGLIELQVHLLQLEPPGS